jgi:CHAD domain-containing protein
MKENQDLITPKSFSEKLEKSESELSKRLNNYLKDPSEENVHDLRTSIRRLLARLDLLPGKVRRKDKSKKIAKEFTKLLRLNAKVRDLDIVLTKIAKSKEASDLNAIARELKDSRKSGLKAARKLASSIKNEELPEVEPDQITGPALKKRFEKVVEKLTGKIEKRLPTVLGEPQNKDELHQLREDSRRLRYTLELDPSSSSNLQILESWQEVLGAIHDSDIFMTHFEKTKDSEKIGSLLERETSGRNDNYEKFCAMAKESPNFHT